MRAADSPSAHKSPLLSRDESLLLDLVKGKEGDFSEGCSHFNISLGQLVPRDIPISSQNGPQGAFLALARDQISQLQSGEQ